METLVKTPIVKAIERLGVSELHGIAWSEKRQEGVVLYQTETEQVCHYFDANGCTYTGSYSGSGDDPRHDFGRRLVSLGIAPRV